MINMATTQCSDGLAAEIAAASFFGEERRTKPRLKGPFRVFVRGADAGGETFELHAVIDNISASGLYVRLSQSVEPGTTLFLLTTLSSPDRVGRVASHLALQGVALRSELTPDGACGVAVRLSHYRFL